MSNDRPQDRSQLKQALGPTADCPGVEQLGRYADGMLEATALPPIESHIAGCSHCLSELALLHEFEAAAVRPEEQRPVAWIAAKLRDRASGIFSATSETRRPPVPWWKIFLTPPVLGRAALVLGCLLVVVSGSIYLRRGAAPTLDTTFDSGAEVARSNTVVLLAPKGDLEQRPDSLQWQALDGAARYRVRILEVDRTEVWSGETSGVGIQIPEAVRARIQPAKSLLWQVTALDASGKRIGSSSLQKFKLSPSPP